MDTMRLPELKTPVLKNTDRIRVVKDGSPRQSDFWDWLESFVSAPPVAAE